MSDVPVRPALHRSVFGKLLAVMLVMALCLTGLVIAFFLHFVNPIVGASVSRMLGDRTEAGSGSR